MPETKTPERDPREIDWPLEHRLTKPVEAHGEQVLVLVLEEPTGEDVLAFGLLEGLDPAQFAPLVVKLAKVPMSTVKAVTARDLLGLATRLNRFFVWAALPPQP